MVKEITVQTLAQELYDALETRERVNGDKFVCLKDGSPQWMTDVIHATHERKMPDDTTYEFVERVAGKICDEDDVQEALYQIEPDAYTHDLTAWLNARVDHVYYLTEALEEMGDVKDGFALLAYAQSKHIQEVGNALIQALESQVESQQEEAS